MVPDASDADQASFTPKEWGVVLLLAAVQFTHIMDFVIVMPLGDALRHQLQITPRQFGFVVSAYGVSAMLSSILTASLVDRFDRKSVLVWAFAGFVGGTFYCGWAGDYVQLVAARAMAGTFGGIAASAVLAIVADFAPSKRGKAIGVITSSFAVASTVGLPIGLWLAQWAGRWNFPFLAIGGLGVGVWFATLWRMPSMTLHRAKLRVPALRQFQAVIRQPNHLWSFVFMLALVFGAFIIIPYIAPYYQANCGVTSAQLPIVYAVAGACTMVTTVFVGWLTDRVGPRPVFLVMASGTVAMTFVITNLPPVGIWGATLSTVAFMVLASGRVVPAQSMMLSCADPDLRGAFTNLNTAVSHLATGVGPLISGSIIGEAYEGGPLTFYWLAGLVAAAFGVTAIGLSFRLGPPETRPKVSDAR